MSDYSCVLFFGVRVWLTKKKKKIKSHRLYIIPSFLLKMLPKIPVTQ